MDLSFFLVRLLDRCMDVRIIEDRQVLLGMTLEASLPKHKFNFTSTNFIEKDTLAAGT
jgi:hypothetical protein